MKTLTLFSTMAALAMGCGGEPDALSTQPSHNVSSGRPDAGSVDSGKVSVAVVVPVVDSGAVHDDAQPQSQQEASQPGAGDDASDSGPAWDWDATFDSGATDVGVRDSGATSEAAAPFDVGACQSAFSGLASTCAVQSTGGGPYATVIDLCAVAHTSGPAICAQASANVNATANAVPDAVNGCVSDCYSNTGSAAGAACPGQLISSCPEPLIAACVFSCYGPPVCAHIQDTTYCDPTAGGTGGDGFGTVWCLKPTCYSQFDPSAW